MGVFTVCLCKNHNETLAIITDVLLHWGAWSLARFDECMKTQVQKQLNLFFSFLMGPFTQLDFNCWNPLPDQSNPSREETLRAPPWERFGAHEINGTHLEVVSLNISDVTRGPRWSDPQEWKHTTLVLQTTQRQHLLSKEFYTFMVFLIQGHKLFRALPLDSVMKN